MSRPTALDIKLYIGCADCEKWIGKGLNFRWLDTMTCYQDLEDSVAERIRKHCQSVGHEEGFQYTQWYHPDHEEKLQTMSLRQGWIFYLNTRRSAAEPQDAAVKTEPSDSSALKCAFCWTTVGACQEEMTAQGPKWFCYNCAGDKPALFVKKFGLLPLTDLDDDLDD